MMYSVLIWTFCILCFTFNGVALRKTNDPNFWDPLIKEVVEAGGYIHPDLQLSWLLIGGLTIIAKNEIPKDTIIMRVPQNLTLKHEDIFREFPSWKNLSILSASKTVPLSLYLAYHATSKGPSPLYVKYSPDSCMNGYYFKYEVVKMMDDRAQEYFFENQEEMAEGWEDIQNAMNNGTIENDEILSSITFSTYKWATCTAYSRRYSRETGVGSLLIPLGDMFNHDPSYNTYWEYIPETSSWIWTTLGVTKGAPITISYGTLKENVELLFVYGFSEKDNPNEKSYLQREVEEEEKHLVLDLYDDYNKYFLRYTPTGITEKELILSRIALLPPHQLTSYHISKLISGDIIWPLERDLWDSIYRKCFSQMKEIPGVSAEEDHFLMEEAKRVLETKKSKDAQRYWETRVAVLQYRIYRRTFVQRVCGWIYQESEKVGDGYDKKEIRNFVKQ